MQLNIFVEFFELVSSSQINGFRIQGNLDNSVEASEKILQLSENKAIGNFEELEINGVDVSENLAKLTDEEGEIEFVYQLSTSGDSNVYLSFQDFLKRNKKLSYGTFEPEFYILDEKLYSLSCQNLPEQYKRIIKLCSLIKGLSDLAHYHDGKAHNHGVSLVFVNETQLSSMNPVVIRPSITSELLDLSELDISIFDELTSAPNELPNLAREKGIFRATLVEFLQQATSDTNDAFGYLVRNWNEFLQLFHKNFDTYLSGFAFHKAKKEVAEAELAIADNLSKIVGEITGKLLGIPLSIAVLITLNKTESLLEQFLLVIGVLIASVIVSEMVHNQQIQLKRIKHAKAISFSALEGKKETYPIELKKQLDEAISGLDKSEKNLGVSLISFRVLSWVPAITSTALLVFMNYSSLDQLFFQTVLIIFFLSLIVVFPSTFLSKVN